MPYCFYVHYQLSCDTGPAEYHKYKNVLLKLTLHAPDNEIRSVKFYMKSEAFWEHPFSKKDSQGR